MEQVTWSSLGTRTYVERSLRGPSGEESRR